jgi:HD-GYP domain-containing protein (c-di-GMP phosphodiesterase class II)/ActR/RegA family two-component response regulator
MRYLKIEEAKPGMILAKGVFDSRNRLLLAQNQELTEEYIRKLNIWGYPGFYIYDELSEGIEVDETISVELRNKGVEALRKQDIDQTLDVAKNIVDQILTNGTTAIDMVDLRTFDDYTYRHSVNVAVIATVLGMGMHLKRSMLEEVCVAAIFHDLGKLMIDSEVLNKPSRLTEEEFKQIKKHPELSVKLLKKRKKVSDDAKEAVLHHHENEDGSGYPDGLTGNEIPLIAKVIHVADVYDALTAKRPYKEPYTPSEAIEYLMGGCNILFDESIVRVFMGCVPVYPKGATITLSDNRMAVVCENNANPLRPKVRVETGEIIDLGDEQGNLSLTVNPSSVVETNYSNEMSVISDESQDGRKRILIADHDVDSLSQIKDALEQNYHVRIVKDGEDALRYLRDNDAIDLLMIDLDLPKINGIDLAKQIRELYGENLPVIFLSNRSDRNTVEQCRKIQAVDYILKPFQPVYVLTRVQIALEGKDETLS